MFGYLWNRYMGAGILVLTNRLLDKSELDGLVGRTQASILQDTLSLAYCTFTNFQVVEASRALSASTSTNLQVPRYGKRANAEILGLGAVTALRSGEIQGAVILIGDKVTQAGSLTYGSGKEVVGSHKYIGLGSPVPTISVTNTYAYYYN